jgi:hypothetical protein
VGYTYSTVAANVAAEELDITEELLITSDEELTIIMLELDSITEELLTSLEEDTSMLELEDAGASEELDTTVSLLEVMALEELPVPTQ